MVAGKTRLHVECCMLKLKLLVEYWELGLQAGGLHTLHCVLGPVFKMSREQFGLTEPKKTLSLAEGKSSPSAHVRGKL